MGSNFPTYVPPGYGADVVDLDPGEIRHVVLGKAVRLWWEQAVQCPCSAVHTLGGRTSESGDPREDCIACGGSGTIYANGQQIAAALTSTTERQDMYSQFGPYAKGTTFITLLPENIGDYLDRYTLMDGVRIHSEIRRRSNATVESLRYPIIRRTFVSGADNDPSSPELRDVGVMYCRAANTDGSVSTEVLSEGVDFTVDSNGRLDWSLGDEAGTAPTAGMRYTVRYYARPRFILDDHAYLRRDLYVHDENGALCFTPMPVRAVALLDFLGRTFSSDPAPMEPDDMR